MKQALLALAFLFPACATRPVVNETPDFKVDVKKADSRINRQTSVADVEYRIRITNRTEEPVKLQRVDIDSTSSDIFSHLATRHFDTVIAPGKTESIDCWVAALVFQADRRKHPPVSMRMTMYLDTPAGLRVESFTRTVKA
ncbi:MAG TPA: hypothetical protein VH087_00480 [Thermoanaerobaculia bacterium]|nr:hypothetical protein [Thermoanaerobaculia bacterium]